MSAAGKESTGDNKSIIAVTQESCEMADAQPITNN